MKISRWLDEQAAKNIDISELEIPSELLYEDEPDETLFFAEVNSCGILCPENHPFSTVERYGHWYYCRGQDKTAGPHSSEQKWHLITRDKNLALKTAKEHIR